MAKLKAAGIDTVPELAQRSAENLATKLVEGDEAKKLVRKVPSPTQVANWVAQAKALPRVLTYGSQPFLFITGGGCPRTTSAAKPSQDNLKVALRGIQLWPYGRKSSLDSAHPTSHTALSIRYHFKTRLIT